MNETITSLILYTFCSYLDPLVDPFSFDVGNSSIYAKVAGYNERFGAYVFGDSISLEITIDSEALLSDTLNISSTDVNITDSNITINATIIENVSITECTMNDLHCFRLSSLTLNHLSTQTRLLLLPLITTTITTTYYSNWKT